MPEILSSRTAFENRWVRLEEDRIRLPDGLEIDSVYVRRPRFVIVAALEEGALWMVEQYRHPLGRRSLELPMGLAPNAEAIPIEEAAAIELREETGLRAARFEHAGEVAPAPALLAQTGALMVATGLALGEPEREDTEQDLTAAPWPVADVLEAAVSGEIVDGVTLSALGLLRLKGRV